MRLRGNANALNRAALQNENRLDKLQRQAPVAAEAVPEPLRDLPDDELPASLGTADLMSFARAAAQPAIAAFAAAPEPVPQAAPVSRQQRRLLERQAEKTRRRQQEQARLAQRAAQRIARRNAPAMRTAQV